MTTNELIAMVSLYPQHVAGVLGAPPLLAFVSGFLHRPGRVGDKKMRYIYATLVYLACIPGITSAVLCAYALFFTNQNLLNADFLVYVLPLVTMGLTLGLVGRQTSFDTLPGVDRLWGLMLILGITGCAVLALHKTRFFIGFFGSFWNLILLAVGLFFLFKFGAGLLFGRGERHH